ncbi:ABC transporter ATP-binding protein [Sulfitobacter sp. THAF37]|uniref:ABC transporter ATP-binding protein n=1 Tax=Sulfitobacter sp. THAF37 TaxID=2587855 RepID=UPI00267618BF|nr:ABC transporter ATP-binding protein [Sulfitobacter sp. THAF37]
MALEISDLSARYGQFRALDGVSMSVGQGETLALVGANGAGKSTFLRILCGLMPSWEGHMTINGQQIAPGDLMKASHLGLALVPEGRMLFGSLTVRENLLIGQTDRDGPWTIAAIERLFPVLREKRGSRPSELSGGQQQMVAIGRALAANPKILLFDEISLGLSPAVVREVYTALSTIKKEGVTLVIVDQDISRVCEVANSVTCFFKGSVTFTGPAKGMTAGALHEAYFGGRT